MDTIRTHGRFLHKALPLHASVGNMARRVLKIVREEYAAGHKVSLQGCHCVVFRNLNRIIYSISLPSFLNA